jgi:valyl-tRNA synthetase
VIPPPNVTAALHLGHALNNTLQDILIRHHRMRGCNAMWMPGTDHAGIATQTVVDKRLQAEGQPALKEYKQLEAEGRNGREQFIEKVQQWKDEYEQRITDQLKEMGCSCDYDRQRFTMDEVCARAVREAFFRLFRDGLIYRGKRLVNWDPVTQTALADDEVEMHEVAGHFWYMKYPIVDEHKRDTGEHATVATTRPETMLGDTAVAVNPDDPERKHLIGGHVRLPIVDRIIPIIGDEHVTPPDPDSDDPMAQYASGFLKVTPAHDPNDYEIGQRHNLTVINVMAPDASISLDYGWRDVEPAIEENRELQNLLGLSREDARQAIVDWFKQHGLLGETLDYRHTVGHSYRSHVPVEPYLSDQWYVKVADDRLAGAALRAMAADQRSETNGCTWKDSDPFTADQSRPTTSRDRQQGESLTPSPVDARNEEPLPYGRGSSSAITEPATRENAGPADWEGSLRFTPARYAKTFQQWHENIRDWCISRQLWWGHRIPVWSGSSDQVAEWPSDRVAVQVDGSVAHVCLREDDQSLIRDIESRGFERDPDVLDTWFSSALWPLSTMGWPDPDAFADQISEGRQVLETWNPTNALCTAREIITLWVSRMVMFNLYFSDPANLKEGDPGSDLDWLHGGSNSQPGPHLPFHNVFVHAMIQDGQGQKMSKSLGNGVDPMDIIHTHGSDAMRFTLASMTTHTQDVRLPVDLICPHTGQQFDPETITTSQGYKVAAPVQQCPDGSGREMVSSFGVSSGQVQPSDDRPLARNSSEKFDLGQRFANKLWNAARFALSNLESKSEQAPSVEFNKDELALADQWILSRLARTVRSANDALREYEFSDYAQCLYDFVWRDLCDWYIELIKPVIGTDPTRRTVLASLLDASLRLLHPAMPFVTERLWMALNEVMPRRGLEKVTLPASELLITAAWPVAEESLIDEGAEQTFTFLQQIVGGIREIRTAYKVAPRQVVDVSAKASSATCQTLLQNRNIVATLTNMGGGEVGPHVERPQDAAATVVGEVELYVHGVIDPETERKRLEKRQQELAKQIETLQGRLENENYVNKAPAHLVQETRDNLAAAEREQESIEQQLNALNA